MNNKNIRFMGIEESYKTFTLHEKEDKKETGGRQSHVSQWGMTMDGLALCA